MEYTQDITLDLNPNTAYPVVTAKQMDIDTRRLHIHYTKDGAAYQINSNNSVILRVRKPDMHMCMIDGSIDGSDGTVFVTLSQQCLTAAGRAYADLLEKNAAGQMLSTVSFIINIMPAPDVMGGEAISSDDFQYLKNTLDSWDRTVAEAQQWVNGYYGDTPLGPSSSVLVPGSNNNSKYFSQRAQAWAEGKIGDEPVPTTDDAYHHNAEWWADEAERIGNEKAQLASENGEAWAIGTRSGAAIPSSDPAFDNYSKYHAQRAEAWAHGKIDGAAIPSSDDAFDKHAEYYAALASQNGEAWSIGTRNGQPLDDDDPAYHNYAKYYSDRISNMTADSATIDLIGSDVDPTVDVSVDEENNAWNIHFNIPRSNAVYVTFDVDYNNGYLYMFRPDVQTYTEALDWNVNGNGELEVIFNA